MMYEIRHKSDFQTGAALTVKIPEAEADIKALYTIAREKPDFLLPLRHRAIDGEIEFAYQVGDCGKFAYFPKNYSAEEYIDLWFKILQPLLDCGDWFMSPYAFLLDITYLYFDKNGKTAKFLYIPSKQPSSDYGDLKNMVTEIAKQIQITDIGLENKVVWAIQDFSPEKFLKMLKSYKPETTSVPPQKKPDDIDINFINFSPEKPAKKGFFGFMGAKKEKTKKAEIAPVPDFAAPGEIEAEGGMTQLIESPKAGSARFRYFGTGGHPETIEIELEEGKIFTIGRFDMSAGVKKSDFEFEAKTKAVSRRHAAVEKNAEGYSLVDLNSSAGTFLDGQKMPPHAPFKLEQGCRISFGFSGADYIWEE